MGKRSPETQEIYSRFNARKSQAQETLKVRKERLDEARKLNRVYGVGRTPNIVVAILKELERAGLSEQFMTVGTHALYAYEALSGVRVLSGALATQDVDLLSDTRQRVAS